MIRARFSEMELQDLLGDDIREELMDRAVPALAKATDVVVTAIRRNLGRDRSGMASPAGEAPGRISGELQQSYAAGKVRKRKYSVSQEYGSEHEAAGLHEFGGVAGGIKATGRRRERLEVEAGGAALAGVKLGAGRVYPPRPAVRPAEEQVAGEVERILEEL